jgi:hypothetical protein
MIDRVAEGSREKNSPYEVIARGPRAGGAELHDTSAGPAGPAARTSGPAAAS